MYDIFLLPGSNLGKRIEYLQNALDLISIEIGKVEKASSSYYETEAWGKRDQPDFINQAVFLRANIPATEVLDRVLNIEARLERQRVEKWGARTIDIDILFYSNKIIDLPNLVVPHKLLHERRFALMPLSELAPDLMHPILKKTINQLLLELSDNLSVKRIYN